MRFQKWVSGQNFRSPKAHRHGSVRRFYADETGVAAIEFALLAPLVIFGLLAMADIGLAVRDRMALDHIVRVGAQTAVSDTGTGSVRTALTSASAGSLTRASSISALSVDVVQECACPNAPAVAVACTTECPAQKPPFIFYTLSAQTVSAGILLPDLPLASRARVQVR